MRSAASWPFGSVLSIIPSAAIALVLVPGLWAQTAPVAPATPPAVNGTVPDNQQAPPAPSATASQGQPGSQEPLNAEPGTGNDQGGMFVFKKQVQEVVLHATVYDEQRNMVPGLDKSAFTVFDDGAQQPITSFRREDVPVAMGIVVDNSGSMRDKREKVNQAVLNLIRASNPKDEIFVVNFSQKYYLDQDFTGDVNLLQTALHQVSARGSTALYDAIVASAVHLKNNPRLDKKVLLVITDGQDNMSQETLQEASRRLQQANGPTLYAVGLLGGGMQTSGRDALEHLAAGTGGVAYFPDSLDQVDNITRTVAHDIRSQYMLAYKPHNQNAKPGYQSVRVEAHAPGYGKLTVRTRSGYFPPEAAH
ncbi:MAG TPA: VWA domain-containing protein [Candidatus Acidoferrum sp.]|nr:VWA domain-containing protein [Candidatus Acidoferrum sp.]